MTQESLRVLYIEDEPDIRTVATMALQAQGRFVVEACGSGAEGLAAFPGFKPDIVLLDVMMPGMDGPTTLKQLRALPGFNGVPAIFMTAKVQPQEIRELKAQGALDVIAKPFDPMALSRTVYDIWRAGKAGRPEIPEPAAESDWMAMAGFAQIADAFAASLPTRLSGIAEMIQRLSPSQRNTELHRTLHRSIHSLAGSATTFGFPLVSHAARSLEDKLMQLLDRNSDLGNQDLSDIRKQFAAVLESAKHPREPIHQSSVTQTPVAIPDVSKIVFVLAAEGTWMRAVQATLVPAGYEIRIFADTSEMISASREKSPVAVLAKVSKTASEAGAIGDRLLLPRPLIYFGDDEDLTTRLYAIRGGGMAFFPRPIDSAALVELLDDLYIRSRPEPYRVILVEDAADQAALAAGILTEAGMLTCVVGDPETLLMKMKEFHPDLVLMDMYLPECTGDELAGVIRQMAPYANLPIVFLSTETDFNKQISAISAGGDEFLTKPIHAEQLISVIRSRVARFRALSTLMVQDSLTGLANHSRMQQYLEAEVSRALRNGHPLSFVIIDVDNFKAINDSHGHPTGDRVLQSLARFLRQQLRQDDMVARYGGEEFALLLANAPEASAFAVVDRLREHFSKLRHQADGGASFTVTFSAGVAALDGHPTNREIILAADRALYRAKETGRNRVVLASSL